MGLALQGQGQLDMAFERLRKVPASGALLDNPTIWRRTSERKRHFGKAQAAYEHILRHDRHFYKDARSRYKRAKAQAGRGGASFVRRCRLFAWRSPEHPYLPGDASVGVPMLGGIDREIGKGAMGWVSGARSQDRSRRGHQDAGLGQEFEGDALIDARAVFPRGRNCGAIAHPNIVTIFDATRSMTLAYIAMEFPSMPGPDPCLRPGTGCCQSHRASIAARVADALDYAHAH